MRESALTQAYRNQAIGLTEYHGWRLPSMFSSPLEEYAAARETAACIDSSFWGRVELGGQEGLDLLHRLSTNDILGLRPGDIKRTVLTSDKGRILDLITVVALQDRLILITSPDSEDQVVRWIEKYTVLEDITVHTITDESVMVSFYGPEAISACSSLLGAEASVASRVSVPWGEVLVIPMRADRQPTIHMVAHREKANEFWGWISAATGRWPIMGVRGFELYRIATGMPIAGAELTDDYNPYDVGLMEYVNLRKGCYIGQEVISRIDTYQKVRFGLKGLLLSSFPTPLGTSRTIFAGDLEAGWMTSCAPDRIRSAYPALGVLRTDIAEGISVRIPGDGGIITGQVVSVPMEWSVA